MSVGLLFAGLGVGFLVGLTGVGGGTLMTPLLILLGVPAPVAISTDLAYSAPTKLLGAASHAREGHVRWRVVGWSALGSVPAALLASLLFRRLVEQRAAGILELVLGAALIVAAAGTILKERLTRRNGGDDGPPAGPAPAFYVLAGAVVGLLVGLTSVGSGTIYTMFLLLFSPLGPAAIVGTDLAHAAILVTAGSLLHAGGGTVDFGLAANLLAGSVPGVLLGSRLCRRLPARSLRLGLSFLVLLAGLLLFSNAPPLRQLVI